jgi:hypothetical protein
MSRPTYTALINKIDQVPVDRRRELVARLFAAAGIEDRLLAFPAS